MKRSELLRILARSGVVLLQHGKRHDIYYSPITGRQVPVPRHAREIAVGTLQSILKDAGINQGE